MSSIYAFRTFFQFSPLLHCISDQTEPYPKNMCIIQRKGKSHSSNFAVISRVPLPRNRLSLAFTLTGQNSHICSFNAAQSHSQRQVTAPQYHIENSGKLNETVTQVVITAHLYVYIF
jgi:hypothetical protein